MSVKNLIAFNIVSIVAALAVVFGASHAAPAKAAPGTISYTSCHCVHTEDEGNTSQLEGK